MRFPDRTTTAEMDQLEGLLLGRSRDWVGVAEAGERPATAVISQRVRLSDTDGRIVDLTGYEAVHGANIERRRVLEADVAHALAAIEEAGMPKPAAPGNRDLLTAVPLLVAATAVLGVYVGLPLMLVTRPVLGALPNTVLFSAAVIVLGVIGVLSVLSRTAAAPPTADGAIGMTCSARGTATEPAGAVNGARARPVSPSASRTSAGREFAGGLHRRVGGLHRAPAHRARGYRARRPRPYPASDSEVRHRPPDA